jgi:hypothetical protein
MRQYREMLKTLEMLKITNIQLKQRLACALRRQTTRAFLDRAEALQLQFIQNDQVLQLLHHDLVTLHQQKRRGNTAVQEIFWQDLQKMRVEMEQIMELCNDLPPLNA